MTDEAGQNHPVATRLPRTHRIKETSNHYRQFLFFPVREGKELIQSLGSGIRPPGLRRRPQHDIVVFAEGSFAVLAVDFGGGGEENQLSLLRSDLKDEFGPLDVCFDRLNWTLNDPAHAHRCRQMKYRVRFVHQFGQQAAVHDAFEDAAHRGFLSQVTDVLDRSGAQVVQDDDLLSSRHKGLGQVGSDEARPACD